MTSSRKQASADYAKGIIHGKDVDVVYTEWGDMKSMKISALYGPIMNYPAGKSYGTWYRNKCNILAEIKHNKEECHLCSDWNGCGKNCTLSKVYCQKCRRSIKV